MLVIELYTWLLLNTSQMLDDCQNELVLGVFDKKRLAFFFFFFRFKHLSFLLIQI